jgi:prevent-host-death family protein
MREKQRRDAKAAPSAAVEQAVQAEPSVITRRGKPAAVVLGYDEWHRLSRLPSFGQLLMSLPLEDESLLDRDQRPLPDGDFCSNTCCVDALVSAHTSRASRER